MTSLDTTHRDRVNKSISFEKPDRTPRDFAARMDYCVTDDYLKANHKPVIKLKHDIDVKVKSGEKVNLNAEGTTDPDGDELNYKWWIYRDVGSYKNEITITGAEEMKASFIAPKVSKPETVHIILTVEDDGDPSLKSYQRVIINIKPKGKK